MDNSFQTLKFYKEEEFVLKDNPTFIKGAHNIICPTDFLLPFQIKRKSSPNPITSVRLLPDAPASPTINLLNVLPSSDLQTISFVGHDYLINYGSEKLSSPIAPGRYRLQVQDGENTWITDDIVFKGLKDTIEKNCRLVRIEYRNNCDLGDTFYKTNAFNLPNAQAYRNIYYADSRLSSPEYQIKEEGEEDLNGTFVLDYVRYEKQRTLETVAPEYIADMFNSLALHSDVNIYDHSGHVGKVYRSSVETTWNTELFAELKLVLTTEVLTKRGCCDETGLVPLFDCILSDGSAVATVILNSENYNQGKYVNLADNTEKFFDDGDTVLVIDGNQVLFQEFDDHSYAPNGTQPSTVQDLNIKNGVDLFTDAYVYRHSSGNYRHKPEITSHRKIGGLPGATASGFQEYKISGESFRSASTHVFVTYFNDSESFLSVVDTAAFLDEEVSILLPLNVKSIRIKCFGASGCFVAESNLRPIVFLEDYSIDGFINGPGGISRMDIEDGFEVGTDEDSDII